MLFDLFDCLRPRRVSNGLAPPVLTQKAPDAATGKGMRLGVRGGLLAVVVAAGAFMYAQGSVPSLLGSLEAASAHVSSLVEAAVPTETHVDAAGPGWATCAPVPVLVNPGDGSDRVRASRVADAKKAITRVAQASGVKLRFAGLTDEAPTGAWAHTDVRVKGYAYAPVLVGWVSSAETDMLASDTWGSAVANPASVDGVRQIVTGAAALDVDSDAQLDEGFGAGLTRGAVLLHELGHVAGLRHGDEGLMAPVVGPDSPGGFSPAERSALVALAPRCR